MALHMYSRIGDLDLGDRTLIKPVGYLKQANLWLLSSTGIVLRFFLPLSQHHCRFPLAFMIYESGQW
jgi:hypothetical protein